MPKKKVTKKVKPGLSRGRTAKQPQTEEVTTSDTEDCEDNSSETAASTNLDSEDVETSQPTTPIKSGPSISQESHQKNNKGTKNSHDWKSWEDLPDLIEELRVQKGKGDGSITYVTNMRQHRKFELDARKELLHMHFDLEEFKSACQTSLRLMRNLHPSGHDGKVSVAIRALGVPRSFEEFVVKLMSLPTPPNLPPSIHVQPPIFEESEEEMENHDIPFTGNYQKFPSPTKMAKYATPKSQGRNGVFHFGTHTKGLSTNKAPRLAKPGEIVYSQGGSPIMQRRIADKSSVQALERLEVYQPDGTKMEVDVVYRGVPDADQIRGFKEFAREVRGIATTRATTAKQNRVQPPKIKLGSQSAVSKSKKPEWR